MSDDRTIQPDALYSVREAAYLLGFRGKSEKANTNRIHAIPYGELARVKILQRKVMFMGRDLIDYIARHRHAERAS